MRALLGCPCQLTWRYPAEVHSPELFGLPYEIVQLCCSAGVTIEGCLMLQTAATANVRCADNSTAPGPAHVTV